MNSREIEVAGQRLISLAPATGAERRRGLLAFPEAPADGLLLPAAPLIHTFGMNFPVDLVWIRSDQVIKVAATVKPGRMLFAPAWLCLELPAGRASSLGIRPGSPVVF